MRNTGKGSEGLVDAAFTKGGAFVFRFKDAADLVGLNGGRRLKCYPQPADFLITHQGDTFFAETKSTSDPTRFSFSMLQPEQKKTGIKMTRASGKYFVFVHRLPTGTWYRLPYGYIMLSETEGKRSLRWDELDLYAWSLPQ